MSPSLTNIQTEESLPNQNPSLPPSSLPLFFLPPSPKFEGKRKEKKCHDTSSSSSSPTLSSSNLFPFPFPMDSCVGKVIYCCVWRNNKILYSYNVAGDHTLDTLAAQCLKSAPVYHSHYLHTVGTRTFAFLLDGTEVYFAILDPNQSSPKSAILKLLYQVRDEFKNNGCRDGEELTAVIGRLVASLEETMSRQLREEEEEEEERNGLSGDSSGSTKALLTGGDGVEVRMEVAEVEASGDLQLQKRRFAKELWWSHFKIVVAVDAGVCLLLFGIWLAVCRGLQCVS